MPPLASVPPFRRRRKLGPKHSESMHQMEVARFLRHHGVLFTATLNGIDCKDGGRAKARAKLEGMEAGVPDLLIFEPRGRFHGLAIEMKRVDPKTSRPSSAQKEFIRRLRERGYSASVEYGASAAIRRIRAYLGIQRSDPDSDDSDSDSSSDFCR